jgi:hypothetical protein
MATFYDEIIVNEKVKEDNITNEISDGNNIYSGKKECYYARELDNNNDNTDINNDNNDEYNDYNDQDEELESSYSNIIPIKKLQNGNNYLYLHYYHHTSNTISHSITLSISIILYYFSHTNFPI